MSATSLSTHRSPLRDARTEAVFDTVREPLLILDERLRVRAANRAFRRLFAHEAQLAAGRPLTKVLRADWDLSRLESALNRTFARDDALEDFEVHVTDNDGRLRALLLNAHRLRDPGATRTSLLLAIEDVTDERLLEEERERADRTQREAERRADEAHRLAQEARFKSQFLSTLAHEIRGPLTPLPLRIFALERSLKAPTPAQKRSIDLLRRNVGRLSRIVNDALDAASLGVGRLPLNPRSCDLAALAQRTVDAHREAAQQARLRLRTRAGRRLPVVADPERIEQVLDNLLTNSLKYTPAGGVVTVSTGREGNEAVARVADTGIGLAPGQIERLFRPFSRVHDPAKVRACGTGLGLYVSRTLALAHGGTLTCASPGPGRGSTFTLRLPLRPRKVREGEK